MTGTNYVVAGVVAVAGAIWGWHARPSLVISIGGIGQAVLCAFLGLAALAEGMTIPGLMLGVALFAFLLGRLNPRHFLPAGALLQITALVAMFAATGGPAAAVAMLGLPPIALALLPWLVPTDSISGSRRRPTPRSV